MAPLTLPSIGRYPSAVVFPPHSALYSALNTHSGAPLRTLLRGLCVLLMLTPAALGQDAPSEADAKAEAKPEAPKAKPEAPKEKVLGLRIEGLELAAKDREDLFKVVQQRLKAYPTIELVRPPDEELTDLMIDLDCLDIDVECLTKVGAKRESDKVFYAQVDVVDGGFRLTVRLIDVTKGKAKRDKAVTLKNQAQLTAALEREIVAAFGRLHHLHTRSGA